MPRVRAALRLWRLVLTCLVVSLVAPSAAPARVEDGIAWVAAAPSRGEAPSAGTERRSPRAPSFLAFTAATPAPLPAAIRPETGRAHREVRTIYLECCALLC